MNTICAVISLILILIVAPILIGGLFLPKDAETALCEGKADQPDFARNTQAYRLISGFIVMLGIWAIMELVFVLFMPHHFFHELRYAYLGTIVLLCAGGIIRPLIRNSKKEKESNSGSPVRCEFISRKICSINKVLKKDWIVIAVFCIILFVQIFNTAYYSPAGYVTDDLYYYNYVNDAVYMDRIYIKDDNGVIAPEGIGDLIRSNVGLTKQLISQWYMFLAFLSATANVDTLAICYTVIPIYILLLLYAAMYVFACWLFPGDTHRKLVFLTASAVIVEAFSYTYYLFFLTIYIGTWGKQVAGMIGLPFLMLSLYMMSAGNRKMPCASEAIHVILMGFGVASFGFSATIVGLVSVSMLYVVLFIREREKTVLPLGIAALLPFAVQLFVFALAGGNILLRLYK